MLFFTLTRTFRAQMPKRQLEQKIIIQIFVSLINDKIRQNLTLFFLFFLNIVCIKNGFPAKPGWKERKTKFPVKGNARKFI
jgi:hypothetical protein